MASLLALVGTSGRDLALVLITLTMTMTMVPGAHAQCTTSACSTACNLVNENNGAAGSCNPSYENPLFGNDPSCICNACPLADLLDIVNLNVLELTCRGPGLQADCSACPQSDADTLYVPHICAVMPPGGPLTELCVCMCANSTATVETLTTCPFALLG